jgi:xanthine dehydrogenase iron-sulfur cluster and FAD-binding subunit A
VAETIEIAFALNRREVRLQVRGDQRLLDVLRDDLRLTGAKEGCGKGECGSCTVLLNGQAVDACLVMAYQADGGVVETIEGLAASGQLHPLQEAFVRAGAVQCGICTPGMILSAKALLDSGLAPGEDEIRHAIAGNLCRCTGYAKIVAAVQAAAASYEAQAPVAEPPGAGPSFFRPRSLDEAIEILALRQGEVRPIAGGTDILVRAKDGHVDRGALFDVTGVPEMSGIEERDDHIWIGACTTHAAIAASPLVTTYAPALGRACALVGAPQIRSRGTLGGNIANASPAADAVPPLFVADAVAELVSVSSRRDVPLQEFFTGPGQSVLVPDELIVGVRLAKRPDARSIFLRLGQRRALAISKVSIAVALRFEDGHPIWARVAVGAVAPTVVRAVLTEEALLTGGYDALVEAKRSIKEEIAPIEDVRSSAPYRREMAAVLLERAVRKLADG